MAFNQIFEKDLKVGSATQSLEWKNFPPVSWWVRNILSSPLSQVVGTQGEKETREVRISNDGNHFLVGVPRGHKNPV